MSKRLPPYIARDVILKRLRRLFAPGAPGSEYGSRETAAATVFAMLYMGAVEGRDEWAAPRHVYRMSDEQAARTSDAERINYAREAERPGYKPLGQAWYADNTREPIRDEVLRQGLIPTGAVVQNAGVKVNSSKGRYALAAPFAELFDPALRDTRLDEAIARWQRVHFDAGARARIRLVRAGATSSSDAVVVNFPNGEVRHLSPGPSSIIAKALIEDFAPRFLEKPAVVLLSDTSRKIVARDDELASDIGIEIDPHRVLPDVILVDLRLTSSDPPILVFAEIVATDGPMTPQRRDELLNLASGFVASRVAFVTAFLDRARPPARKLFSSVGWNTLVWYAGEPHGIVALHDTSGLRLHDLIRLDDED